MSSNTLARPVVPSFESIDQLCGALSQKGQGNDIDLYPRDGSHELFVAENTIAKLNDTDPENASLHNSGMTALREALDVAVETSGTKTPTIAYSGELYAKTTQMLYRYARRHGLRLVDFDSGSTEDVDYTIEKEKPDVIISETVSNGPNMPVLDHEHLLNAIEDTNCAVILDHTLPLNSGYNILDAVNDDDRVIVVESGTKGYALNAELAGITFIKNPEFRQILKAIRCEEGGIPGVASTRLLNELFPESKEQFDLRNRAIYDNTAALARVAHGVQGDFVVKHPALKDHANHRYAQQHRGGNVSPVFYIRARDGDQISLAKRLESHPTVREHAEFGQSFGFDTARILPDAIAPVVRIAGGAKTDTETLGQAIQEALTK